MEKGKSESSERSFGESESVVSSQSDIQPENTMESHDEEIKQPEEASTLEVETENEDLKDSIRTLTEKLSAALANVNAKDDLVNQHVKVAEEAVAGWEKAENEVVELKEKLDASEDKNRELEDRVSHLDGALKECVRQLRQARDEQEQRVQDAVTGRTHELQASKANLEGEIFEAATKSEELAQMAESVAKENVMLRHELIARCEELEIRTIERDLSTQAAETASKQQLDVIKKVAKLEAECRKLRTMLSKSSFNDHRSTDSHSDASCSESGGASSMLIEKRSLQGTSSSIEIDLMGDFLEMERLVALPETPDGNGKSEPESVTEEAVVHTDNSLVAEIEALTYRNKELEEKLEKLEAVKDELESEVKCCREVESTLRFELDAIFCEKVDLESKLEKLKVEKDKLESKVESDREVESTLRLELEAIVCDKVELESKLEKLEAEREELESKVKSEKEVVSTVRLDLEAMVCDKVELEKKLNKLEAEKDEHREVESTLKLELEAIVSAKVEVENKLEKMEVEKAELQISYDIIKDKYKESQVCLQDIETKLEEIQREMKLANELKTEVESQIESMEAEAECNHAKIESLEEEVRRERLASDELRRKCEALEEEVTTLHQETAIEPPKIKQEDMATAAGKLANCQKTIASLGKQLQSLATLEDFLVDTTSIQVATTNGVSSCSNNTESWRVHKNDTYMSRNHFESIKATKETSSDAALTQVSSNRGSSEKNRNGFAKVFTRSKDGIHLVI
ncbi:unnamed protein product [Eruca vesicaria subsp. sativa]|uniref:Filament-like plant protein n=1 Tax=Eruca vesicaria subsp. sativa TaxID=29727 RepID=A0ABC8KCW3_ERUVS|nr:unnamed protein product [Eruca vesicaria subsp. sativa]